MKIFLSKKSCFYGMNFPYLNLKYLDTTFQCDQMHWQSDCVYLCMGQTVWLHLAFVYILYLTETHGLNQIKRRNSRAKVDLFQVRYDWSNDARPAIYGTTRSYPPVNGRLIFLAICIRLHLSKLRESRAEI